MRIIGGVGFLLPLMTVSIASWANGGPVAWTEGKPVGGIEPKQENSVELLSENLNISVTDLNTYKVDANYLLRNPKSSRRITYGVPLYWVGKLNPEEAASGIKITVEKKSYRCHAENPKKRTDMESREKSEMYGDVGDAWCIAEIDVPKGDAIRLRLTYTADLEYEDWEFSKSAKTEFSNRTLIYPLAPAGYWNGNPELNVSLKLGPYKNSVNKLSPEGSEKTVGKLTWHKKGADLKSLKELRVEFNAVPLLQHHELASWNAGDYPAKKTEGNVVASSTLESSSNRYAAMNMMDGDPSTAWCEGKKGNGNGESFTVQLEEKQDENHCSPEGIAIVPGYAKTAQTYLDNGRVKKLRIEDCQDPSSYTELLLQPTDQYDQSAIFIQTHYSTFIPSAHIESKGGKWASEEINSGFNDVPSCLRFIIKEAVPGQRFDDTCISEVAFVRNCG